MRAHVPLGDTRPRWRVVHAGERVGGFTLGASLGEGATGRVWRADGPSGAVAIKLLSLEVMGVRERFEREARALMKLDHANVVRALGHGHADDGTPFIALELLDGETLEERLLRLGRIGVEEAVAITAAAAAGLSAAHQHRIVHRDVTPGNIFLCKDGAVKVLDFGIAFWTESDPRLPVSRLTEPGTVMGTPSYMAPEQAAGKGDEDERTDVWGLGAVLYHAISGREPFGAGGNYLAELARILTEPPDPLPDDVPPSVAVIVGRALSKDREARFATMASMADALGAHARERAAAAAPPPNAASGALADEVRLVSALLVEDLADGTEPQFLEAVGRHGGVGSPLRGGGAVAIFGGEQWLGDEAERAIKAALAIRDGARRIGVGTGKALRRAGVGGSVTGEAFVAAQVALAAMYTGGHTLRPAAPADTTAAPATVVVCPETRRRVQGGFQLAGARVLGIRAGGRALRPREVAGREVPFVGRDQELDRLIDFVEDVEADVRAGAALIVGPPGIGKSRLRFELLKWMAEEEVDARHLEGRGDPAREATSFGLMRELVRKLADLPEGTEAARGRVKIEALVASADLDEETGRGARDFIGELLGVPFPATPHLEAARANPRIMSDRIRIACHDLFEGWTRRGLVLVSVEDAQWADGDSLSLLGALLERLCDRALAVVVTARPGFVLEQPALAAAVQIELGELATEDTARIVACVLGHAEAAVVERAGGNPYLAEELSLAVREGADPDALPLTVEGAVLARLDKLGPSEKDLLKRAAVLGRRFWREALEALGEARPGEVLLRLRHRDLVIPRDDSRLYGCEEWLFRQAVVYEVCRGLLTLEQKRTLHKAAASWLSRRLEAAPDEIAQHFSMAEEPQRAVVWWMRATHAAHARGDSHNAVRFGERVLALAEASSLPSADALAIRLVRCEALYWQGDHDGLERELVLAQRLAEGAGAPSAAAMARLRRWQAQHVQRSGHLEPATAAAKAAVRLADDSAVLDLRVESRAALSELMVVRGELGRAAEIATEALEIAKRGEGSLIRATAARAVAEVEALRGNSSAALFHYSLARNLCIDVGALREATICGIGLGGGLADVGDWAQAERMLEKTLATARALEHAAMVGWVKHHLARVALGRGDPTRATALLRESVDIARRMHDVHLEVVSAELHARIELDRGDADAALSSADLAVQMAVQHGERAAEIGCRLVRSRALSALGRHDDALDECGLAEQAREQGATGGEVELWLTRHAALSSLDRAEEAALSMEQARRAFDARLATLTSDALREAYRSLPTSTQLEAKRTQ